jgi:hypothetical protein
MPLSQPALAYPRFNSHPGDTTWNLHCAKEGWIQLANDAKARRYQQLFYELVLEPSQQLTLAPENSIYLSGISCRSFLEKALDLAGLNPKDCNDFLTYWLPQMEGCKKVQLQLLTSELGLSTGPIQLKISEPCSLRRIFMIWKAVSEEVSSVPSSPSAESLLARLQEAR